MIYLFVYRTHTKNMILHLEYNYNKCYIYIQLVDNAHSDINSCKLEGVFNISMYK